MNPRQRSAILGLLACVGCSSSGPSPDPLSSGDSPDASTPPPSPPAPTGADAGAPDATASFDLHVSLIDRDVPVAGRTIVVADARGRTTSGMSAADGSCSFPGVTPPYDVALLPTSGALATQAFLGLHAADVRIDPQGAGSTNSRAKATINAAIAYPSCPSGCSVQIFTSSPHGFGSAEAYPTGPARIGSVSFEHDWTPSAASEVFAIDVLVADAGFTNYWYAHADRFSLAPNATENLGTLIPQPISTFGPVTITANDAAIPTDWQKAMQMYLHVPGATPMMSLQRVASSSLVTFLPNVPGATFSVTAWRNAADILDAAGNSIETQDCSAMTDSLPLSTNSVALSLDGPPKMIAPLPQGTLSRSDTPIAWAPRAGALTYVSIWPLAGMNGFNVVTSESSLSAERLRRVGIELATGQSTFMLETIGALSMDEIVDPRATKSLASGNGYARHVFRFTVLP
jgi:hypothetical protein